MDGTCLTSISTVGNYLTLTASLTSCDIHTGDTNLRLLHSMLCCGIKSLANFGTVVSSDDTDAFLSGIEKKSSRLRLLKEDGWWSVVGIFALVIDWRFRSDKGHPGPLRSCREIWKSLNYGEDRLRAFGFPIERSRVFSLHSMHHCILSINSAGE